MLKKLDHTPKSKMASVVLVKTVFMTNKKVYDLEFKFGMRVYREV
jgi:hypothetical protein